MSIIQPPSPNVDLPVLISGSTAKLVLVLLALMLASKGAFLLTAGNVSLSSVDTICILSQWAVRMCLTARSSKMCAK